MRAFIALELPRTLADDTAALARSLARTVPGRFLPRENYHVTLAFLGEVGEDGASRAIGAIERACRGRGPVELAPDRLGVFGRGRASALWLGFAWGGADDLARDLRAALEEAGVPFDAKPFRAHATIARRAALPRDLGFIGLPAPAAASHVTLFKSTLSSDGASYKPLFTCELAGGTA